MKIRLSGSLSAVPLCFAAAFGVLVIFRARASLDGMRAGLEMCASVVIPSLFPFMVISSFASRVGVSRKIYAVADGVMRRVFHLPGDAVTAVVFGLLGGFPVGCSAVAQLYKDGRITQEQAQRLTLFCINAGPGFTVTAVGTVMLGSTKAGLILFAALCLSSVIIGFFLRFTAPVPEKKQNYSLLQTSVLSAFVDATEHGAKSMLRICAWVSLFFCIFSIVGDMGLNKTVQTVIMCVAETTSGCKAAAETGNIFIVAATLGWSGFCVVCQIMGDVRCVGTPISALLAFRAVHAGLSTVICRLLLYVFPIEVSVFSSFSGRASGQLFSASAPAAVALMCLCIVFVVDLDRNKKMC